MTETSGSEPSGRRRFPIEKAQLSAGLIGFVLFFVVSGALVGSGSGVGEQPVRFNHRIHTVDNEMACTECHTYYLKEAFSGLPNRDTCAFCHEEPQGKSEKEMALVEFLKTGAPLEWKPLFRQPPHVFYSHRRHVQAGEIECQVCHGDIGKSEAPPRRVRKLKMNDCVGCHVENNVRADCTTCHR